MMRTIRQILLTVSFAGLVFPILSSVGISLLQRHGGAPLWWFSNILMCFGFSLVTGRLALSGITSRIERRIHLSVDSPETWQEAFSFWNQLFAFGLPVKEEPVFDFSGQEDKLREILESQIGKETEESRVLEEQLSKSTEFTHPAEKAVLKLDSDGVQTEAAESPEGSVWITGASFQKIFRQWPKAAALVVGILIIVVLRGGYWSDNSKSEIHPGLPEQSGGFTVQVAAFKEEIRAKSAMQKLSSKTNQLLLLHKSEDGKWFRLRVGQYATRSQADSVARSLTAKKVIREYFIARYVPSNVK